MTGGRRLGPTDSPFNEGRPRELVDVSSWLVGAALVTFVLDGGPWLDGGVSSGTVVGSTFRGRDAGGRVIRGTPWRKRHACSPV
jgi:hypothetical protein